ncbi:hypothetical protein [Enterococcus sp. AZ126]|uniref:hypothetical protein n=1 Tax=Enterococcus sp. AZ126 TaxID=2774635 RepID=UPI003F1FE4EF
MTLKKTVKMHLEPEEIIAIKHLKEKNRMLYSIEYKLDLSFFNMTTNKVNHLLCWHGDELVGYAALSNFDPKQLEITMIAKPDSEIFTKMNEAVLEFSQQRNIKEKLLITDHNDTFVNEYLKGMNKYKYSFQNTQ